MYQYSKQVKQQVAAYDRTFSTTLNNNYKTAFLGCKKSGDKNTCNEMTREVGKVEDTFKKIQALELEVALKVNKNKKLIEKEKNNFYFKKTILNNKVAKQQSISDVDNASFSLKSDSQDTLYMEYFYLAFYIFAMLVFTFILKQCMYSWTQIVTYLILLTCLIYFTR